MQFNLELTWLLLVLLVSIRFGVVFFASPFDALGRLPARIRVLSALGLSATLVSALGLSFIELPSSLVQFGLLAISEALIGLILAFGFYAAFGSIMVAGKLLDFQAGFGAAQILNPTTNAANPLFGTLLALFGLIIFFISDAYQVAIRGLSWSLNVLPPGSGVIPDGLKPIVGQFGITYLYGVIIAAPVIGVLLLLDTGIAVIGRSMPQMNVYFLFLPLKIFAALALVMLALRYLTPVLEQLFLGVFRYWQLTLSQPPVALG
jgi:flagellar biosynthetic protein FliR